MRLLLRRLLAFSTLAVLATLFASGRAAAAPARFTACGQDGLECATIQVPLDRTGVTPGTLPIYVERLPAEGFQRGTMFLIAGGPGQPSAETFNLSRNAAAYRQLFPGYQLVAYDDRGTGKSNLIICPRFQATVTATVDQQARLAAECANSIGPTRVFYGTRDHAEDIEAVRKAIGVDKVGLWGTSYGTKLAVAYALAHPDHTERLLLDSVVRPEGPDPFGLPVLQEMPNGLRSLCFSTTCAAATPDIVRDVAALANRLAAHPLTGTVLRPSGKPAKVRVDGPTFLGIVVDTDLNPGLAAELPAAVNAALHGRPAPLLRIVWLDLQSSSLAAQDLSFGLFLATNCDDGQFPWDPSTPVAQRKAIMDAARTALPAGATGPFGRWATDFGTAALCLLWPSPAGGDRLPNGPYPDVPVLLVNGDRDLRTPLANAFVVASRFPHAQITVVPGVGHSVIGGADYTGCADNAVRAWLNGAVPTPRCPRVAPFIAPLAAFPRSVANIAPVGAAGARGRTLAAVIRTVREAGASWLLAPPSSADASVSISGPYGGRLRPAANDPAFNLNRYATVPGVQVSGRLRLIFATFRAVIPFRFEGTLKVGGPKAVRGELDFAENSVTGTLGGRRVRARL
jgi:pimeloyl-ACP methyl ester carboxylesterase